VTDDEVRAIHFLDELHINASAAARRFVADCAWNVKVHQWITLSPRQSAYLWRLVQRYSNVMPAALVAVAARELARPLGPAGSPIVTAKK
jgi:hypothetical protein